MASPATSFLDLPPEVRVKIYEFAIPQQLLVKKQSADLVANHEILTSNTDDILPRFMFANRLIMQECFPLFWSRVTFDTTDFELQTTTTITTTTITTTTTSRNLAHPPLFIFTTPHWLRLIQSIKILATLTSEAGIFEALSSLSTPSFPNLRHVTLTIPPAEMHERHLRRLYVSLRHGKDDVTTGQKTPYTLELLLHAWLQAWLQAQNSTTTTTTTTAERDPDAPTSHQSRVSALAEKCAVYVELFPHAIEHSWLYVPRYGIVHEITQRGVMCTLYSLETDVLSCSFDDVRESAVEVVADDHDAYFLGTPLPGVRGEHVYPKLYLGPEHFMARKRRGVLEVLVHKEMSRRGLSPDLETQRYNTRGEAR